MKNVLVATAVAIAAMSGVAGSSALAANARHPYANVNHRNDRGNNTGDPAVERLNSTQLDLARGGSNSTTQSLAPGSVMNPAGNRSGTQN